MNAISFSATERADFSLLIGSGEGEACDIRPAVDVDITELDEFLAVADRLPHVVIRVQHAPALLDIRQLYTFAELDFSAVGFF